MRYRKRNIKKIIIMILVIILLIGTAFLNRKRIQLLMKGYGLSDQNIILSLDDDQIEHYLSVKEVIDFDRWDKYSNHQYYYDYNYYAKLNLKQSDKDIIKYIDQFYDIYNSQLKKLKYDMSACRTLMKKLSIDDFSIIAKEKYTYSKIKKYLEINGCQVNDIAKYLQTNQQPLEAILSISYPFIDSSKKINQYYQIKQPDNLLALIKKGFSVSEKYEPKNLVEVNIPIAPDNDHGMLRKEAADALEKMYQDALKEDYHLVLNSGYRSYADQQKIYDEYFKKYDEVTARGLVALPGSSEHQLGLGVDLTSQSVIDKERMVFGDTKEYKWVIKNAYKYGFILRYPQKSSSQTGTANEPWHFRYVGKKVAKEIYDNEWTLEDYILKHGFSYDLTIDSKH